MRFTSARFVGFLIANIAVGAPACGGSFEGTIEDGSGGTGTGGVSGVTGGVPGVTGGVRGDGGSKTGGTSGVGGSKSTGGNAATGGAGGGKSCIVGDVAYADGMSWKSDCNSCTCLNGSTACTDIACFGRACGAELGNTCAPDEYCAYAGTGLCGAADATATCAKRPQICPGIFAPVCACDGKTYSSACDAAAAGVGFSAQGECGKPGSCTIGNQVYLDGTTNIPAGDDCNVCSCTAGTAVCTQRPCKAPTPCGGIVGGGCAPDEYCDYDVNTPCTVPDAAGLCRKRPEAQTCPVTALSTAGASPASFGPVICGCDGRNYLGECAAHSAGTDVATYSSCPIAIP